MTSEHPPSGQRPVRKPPHGALMATAGAGFEFAASVAAFAVGGWFLDRWQGTTPTWTLIGLAIGLIGGGYNLYKAARRLSRMSVPARTRRVDERPRAGGGSSVAGQSGAEHEHVPAFEAPKKVERSEFGMFAREAPGEEAMADADEIRWPEDAPARDTMEPDEEGGGERG